MIGLIPNVFTVAKEREKAQKKADKSNVTSPSSSRASSVLSTPVKSSKKLSTLSSGASTPTRKSSIDQRQLDLFSLNLDKDDQLAPVTEEPLPIVSYAKEKLIDEVKKSLEQEGGGKRKCISLVVIGMSLECKVQTCGFFLMFWQVMLTLANQH